LVEIVANAQEGRPLFTWDPLKEKEIDPTIRVLNWTSCVEEWSMLRFPFISDKNSSLLGLASAAEAPGMGKCLAGLWDD
jgi:hypothetical protein